MPMKTRNYARERELQIKRGEHKDNAERKRIRRLAEKQGLVRSGDGKDLDHKKPLSKGGSNKLSNIRVTSPSANRSFKRNKDGSMR